ncbi:MAG: cAMP protein kinase regulatory chain [Myxococcales bacterium]|nr:cAMP protein kinase regulatory chain [Myxococcales bacterium]
MNRRAFLLGAAMVMLCNLVAVTLRSFAEVAFLEAYGASKLPWLLIANAGAFAVATLGYDLITRRAHTRIVDLGLLIALLIAAAVGPTLLRAGAPPVVLVVALAATSQVAGLALWNRVAAAVAGRDARRMLPRAGAAVTLGGAIAGLGAGVLVYRLGLTVLPYLGAAATAIVIALSVLQARALATGGAPGATAPAGTPEGLGALQQRLLGSLIAVALLEGIVATVIDLQFISMLKGRYSGDTLAVAVTLFYGGTNAILFLLQVLAVPRILVTRSLPTTAAIHPVMALAWYLVFAAVPGFVTLAGTRTSDQVLRLATSRTSQEIELSAFPPGPRARWKVLLRGGIWPLGAALGAIVLLVIGPKAIAHPRVLALAAMGVAILWFIAGQIAARRFQAALAAPLGIRAHRAEDLRQIELGTLERWSQVAGSDDPRDAGLARAALTRARIAATDLADHLRHDEPAVRAALFEQLARAPSPALRGELRAAVTIEDDDRALALGLKALALAGDDGALDRGRSRAALSREVAEAVHSAEVTLRGGDVAGELIALCARDPEWAVALVRARRSELTDAALTAALLAAATTGHAGPSRSRRSTGAPASSAGASSPRTGALLVIARVGPDATMPMLVEALEAGEPAAIDAISDLDAEGAAHLASKLALISPLARAAIARALAGAPTGTALIGMLLSDEDPDVAHAALRTALAIARGGATLPAEPIANANRGALAALVAHLDARDAAGAWSVCARHELDLALRRCVVRLLWAAAVEAAATGRDPAPLAATARHLIGGREPDRRRALDVVQELQAGRAEILGVLERWLRPAVPRDGTATALATFDPWLAALCAGELVTLEPLLLALRKPALFATVAGPTLASLAARASVRSVTGTLFAQGADGDTMFVVTSGTLIAQRTGVADRTIEVGGVVGELAVLTRAPRAATVIAMATAEILEIDRATFAAASRRAPELVLGLSATLAGWLAPERPDVL